jgi:hypothetical protein
MTKYTSSIKNQVRKGFFIQTIIKRQGAIYKDEYQEFAGFYVGNEDETRTGLYLGRGDEPGFAYFDLNPITVLTSMTRNMNLERDAARPAAARASLNTQLMHEF